MGVLIGTMAMIQIVLALGELRVLQIASGLTEPDDSVLAQMLTFGIILAFSIPAAESLIRMVFAMDPSRTRRGKRSIWVIGVILAVIAFGQAVSAFMS
ncbi:hypothetical protein ACWENQ_06465 [Nonomuraea sp. NPDC004354]